jgi:hypothetical protein
VLLVGAVPDDGEIRSQFPPLAVDTVAVQPQLPPPELETRIVWLGGLAPLCALKLSEVGLTASPGAAVKVKLTLTVWGEFARPLADTWIEPV